MVIPLISGQFESQEAIDLLTQIIDVKIKFHENKINNDASEEDIKYRESKIIQLQRTRVEINSGALSGKRHLRVSATAAIE